MASESSLQNEKPEEERVDAAMMADESMEYVPGSAAEKRLLRKIDFTLIPCCWLLYVLEYVDRSNVGNARTGGLQRDFNLTSTQYQILLLVFYIPYVLLEIPSNMLITRVRPSYYLCTLAVLWGTVAASMGATKNWGQFTALRVLLGAAETAFVPGATYWLSTWYRKYELAGRYSTLYSATAVSGIVSGLLAGIILQNLDGASGIAGWRWIFIIEGCMSIFVGLTMWMIMPDYASNTRWLNKEERALASRRLELDGIGLQDEEHRISTKLALKMALTDWRVWILVLLYSLVIGAQTVQYFIPTLVATFGWTGFDGQYHTIPAYACALVFILVGSFLADHFKQKALLLTIISGIGTVFFIATVTSDNNIVRYVCSIFAFGSIYGCAPLVKTWVAEVVLYPAEKRSIAIALVNAVGNTAAIYGVFLWPESDAPEYKIGFAVTTAWMGCICIGGQVAAFLFKRYPIKDFRTA